MDCRNFKDLLDSYLSEELAVETNHQMLSHTEHCPPCRSEMASRRNMRESLRRACSKDRMSEEACERLRLRLLAEAASVSPQVNPIPTWLERLTGFFNIRYAIPAAAALLILGAIGVFSFLRSHAETPTLSDALMTEAANDHRKCAPHFIPAIGPMEMPESVKDVDTAYFGLEKVAATGAKDLQLHSAHLCRSGGRQFAHLVYTRNESTISLLVTARDQRALKSDADFKLSVDHAKMQEAIQNEFALGAYQTVRHVVVVVSDLPKNENKSLTKDLAMPVVEYLRRFDNQSVVHPSNNQSHDLLASKRGGRSR